VEFSLTQPLTNNYTEASIQAEKKILRRYSEKEATDNTKMVPQRNAMYKTWVLNFHHLEHVKISFSIFSHLGCGTVLLHPTTLIQKY
jgi:hypothetical protein